MVSTIGRNIKKFREIKNWSINKLHIESGVGYATIHDIESGKNQNLSLVNVEKLSKALNVNPDTLMGNDLDLITYEVNDIYETFNMVLTSDDLTLDDVKLTKNEIAMINDYLEFMFSQIRKVRSK